MNLYLVDFPTYQLDYVNFMGILSIAVELVRYSIADSQGKLL